MTDYLDDLAVSLDIQTGGTSCRDALALAEAEGRDLSRVFEQFLEAVRATARAGVPVTRQRDLFLLLVQGKLD